MKSTSSTWQLGSESPPPMQRNTAKSVPLKWATESRTGNPRYIHDEEVVNGNAECECPACRLPLTPVLAGQPERRDPTSHFRHPAGSQKAECVVVAARLAAVRHLLDLGFIDLPRRRKSATAVGFSGEGYEGWAEVSEERAFITRAVLQDRTMAVLTLEGGRELLVDLTGQLVYDGEGKGRAIVSVPLSDPAIAMMSPEEIRSRLRLLPDGHWCAHWSDEALSLRAQKDARQTASSAMDAWTDIDEAAFQAILGRDAPPAEVQKWRRETVLHREVKSILADAAKMAIPGMRIDVVRQPPEEFSDEWEQSTLRLTWLSATESISLDKVVLERRLGRIVPDVICTLSAPRPYLYGVVEEYHDYSFQKLDEEQFSSFQWPESFLIEVTVTHGIDNEKLRRIQELDLPTLEIDISSLGGRVTRDGLKRLVVEATIGKRWVHHPHWRLREQMLNAMLDEHPSTIENERRLKVLRRPRLLARPAKEWAETYVLAATEYLEARRATGSINVEGRQREDDLWQRIQEASEALEAHGYPGAGDNDMLGSAGIVSRLLSIQNNRGIGYAVRSGYQVLSAIMQSTADHQLWHTLYPMAVKAYDLEKHFTPKQAERYSAWRQSIIDKVTEQELSHLRPSRYDAVLSILFPAMAPRLAKGYGLRPESF